VLRKKLDKDCIEPASMLEKKRRVPTRRRSAHRILWIYSGLSTVETLFCLQQSCYASFGAVGKHQVSKSKASKPSRQRSSPAFAFLFLPNF